MKFNPRCSTVSTLVSAAMRRSPCFVPLLKNSSSLRIRDAAGEHLISLFSPCERTGTALLLSLLTRIIPVEAFLRSWNIPCSFRPLVRSMARACTAASLSFYLCNERSWAIPPVLLHLRLFLLVILSRKKKKKNTEDRKITSGRRVERNEEETERTGACGLEAQPGLRHANCTKSIHAARLALSFFQVHPMNSTQVVSSPLSTGRCFVFKCMQ